MKAISILQPWASLVILGHKKIETRSWDTKYRGPLLIHASAGKKGLNLIDKQDPFGDLALRLAKLDMDFYDYPLGAIIGVVDLVETFQFGGDRSIEYVQSLPKSAAAQEIAFGDWNEGRWGWRLENPKLFDNPIPAKGALQIWEYSSPPFGHVKATPCI
jgi:hypothetical protein